MPKYLADPVPFVVIQDTKPQKGKKGECYTVRMGGYVSLEEAKKAIEKNEREMKNPNSYGGLIDWGDDMYQRSYRIYKATYEKVA